MGILTRYISEAPGGTKRIGCVNLANDLMRGDPAKFKQGYTAENAYIATVEAADREGITLTTSDRAYIGGALGITCERRGELEGMVIA